MNDLRTGNLLWTGDSYWVRVKVENNGRTRAEKIQVSLSNLYYRPGVDGEFSEDARHHFPLNLKWAHIGAPILDGISPDMVALCDVIALSDPANPHPPQLPNIPSNATVGRLQLEVNLPPEFDSLRPGSWKLTLRIDAAVQRTPSRLRKHFCSHIQANGDRTTVTCDVNACAYP